MLLCPGTGIQSHSKDLEMHGTPELGDGEVGVVGGLPALVAHDTHPYVGGLDHCNCMPAQSALNALATS